MKFEAGGFVFVSCEGIAYSDILVLAVGPEGGAIEEVTAWSASGTGILRAGDELTYGVAPYGVETNFGPKAISNGVIQVEVYLSQSSGTHADEVYGIFDWSAVSEEAWLRSDGSKHADPCD